MACGIGCGDGVAIGHDFHTFHCDSNGAGRISQLQFSGGLGPLKSGAGNSDRIRQRISGLCSKVQNGIAAVHKFRIIAVIGSHIDQVGGNGVRGTDGRNALNSDRDRAGRISQLQSAGTLIPLIAGIRNGNGSRKSIILHGSKV